MSCDGKEVPKSMDHFCIYPVYVMSLEIMIVNAPDQNSTAWSYLTENRESIFLLDELRAVVPAEVRGKKLPPSRDSPPSARYTGDTRCATPCLCGRFRIGVHTCITHWFSIFNNVTVVSISQANSPTQIR